MLKDVPPHLVRVASDWLDQLETSGDLLAHGLGLVAALDGRAAADYAARAVVWFTPHSKRFTRPP